MNPPLFIGLALAGLILRLALIWAGWCDAYVVADDAYYYFTIARNVAAGLGSTFDSLAPTNGYHPLYMLSLVPIFRVVAHSGDPWLPIRLALTLIAVVDVATGVVLFSTLRALGFRRGATWSAAAWWLAPFGVLVTLRGLETSFCVFLVAVWLWWVARAGGRGWPSHRGSAGLGAIYGLAILARTDNAPLMGVAFLAQAIVWVRAVGPGWRRVVVSAAIVVGVASAVVVPWVSWNLARFGSPWQVSGVAKMTNPRLFGALVVGRPWLVHTPGLREMALTGKLLVAAVRYPAGEELKPPRITWILGPALAGLIVIAVVRTRSWSRAAMTLPLRLVGVGGATYLAGFLIAYGWVLRTYVPWYGGVPTFLLSGWVAAVIGEQPLRGRTASGIMAALALAACLGIYSGFFLRPYRVLPRWPELALQPFFARIPQLAPEARFFGSYNAGHFGYFASTFGPYRVVNLDCLVNNRALAAWRKGRYLEYVTEHVDFLWVDPAELKIWLSDSERQRLTEIFPPGPEPGFFGPRRPTAGASPHAP